jgi:hypothetical protein
MTPWTALATSSRIAVYWIFRSTMGTDMLC